MKRTFEKKMGLLELLKFWIAKLKWVCVICICTFIVAFACNYIEEKNRGNEIVNVAPDGTSNYVCSTLISVIPDKPKDDSQIIGEDTYLSVMISNSVIQSTIDELGLSDSFIDLFHKMSWEIRGYTIKLTITSPVDEIDGYSWDEVMSQIVKNGKEKIENAYDISSFSYIDEPYYENEKLEKIDVNSSENHVSVNLMAFATSLSPLPVTTETTVSSLPMSPSSHAFLTAAVPVTPAGSPNTPQVLPSSFCAARISSSVTLIARPFDSRIAMSALSALRGTPTEMESAIVFSSIGSQGLFSWIARLRG